MRQFKFLVLAMSVGFVGAAHAANSGSEFWYQPKGGQNAVKLEVATSAPKIELKAASGGTKLADLELIASPLLLSYEYGLNEKNSLGAYLNFGTSNVKTSTVGGATSESKYSGMSDIHVTYKGNLDGALHYGADLGLGMSKKKEATATKDGDNANGGLSLEPYVGYNMGNYGVKLAYLLNMERTSTDQGTPEVESKTTGGNVLTLTPYYELNYGPGAVDFYLAYASHGDSTTTPTGGTASTSLGYTSMTLGARGNYDVASSVSLLYEVDYIMVSDFNTGNPLLSKASGSGTYLGAGVRMTF